MRSGRPESAAPGREDRPSRSGPPRVYWRAPKDARAAGFEPAMVRIHDTDEDAINARCRVLQAEAAQWIAEKVGGKAPKEQPTLNDLIRAYRTREESAYHTVKWNTRRTYDKVLDAMERGVGETALYAIKFAVIKRWYEAVRYPEGKGSGRRDHARSAQGFVAMLRRVVRFGAAIEMRDCGRISDILRDTKWEGAPKRSSTLDLHHVEAIVAKAHEIGRPSLALGTVLQWETMLRQRDVIGEWEPYDTRGKAPDGHRINGRVWANGLTWEMVGEGWMLTKRTTKTGAVVLWDLSASPLVMAELQCVPARDRRGPMILDEAAKRPYAENRYQQEWRKVADAAGVPREVKNMDARSGGATEADAAGAAGSDIQRGMGHSDPKTTARYIRGPALDQTRRVTERRQAHRARRSTE